MGVFRREPEQLLLRARLLKCAAEVRARVLAQQEQGIEEEGWPHASLLSAGDMLAVQPARIRFLIFPDSVTTRNLVRDGRVTVTISFEGGMWELRFRTRRLAEPSPEVPLACFEATLERPAFIRCRTHP